jgi:hypothetical protein
VILVVVPCGAQKIWDTHPDVGAVPAQDAYTSAFFKTNRAYVERFGDHWVILSAKYGSVPPQFLIPGLYDVSFNRTSSGPISLRDLQLQIRQTHLAA